MAQDPVPPLPQSSSNTKGCLIGCAVVFFIGVVGAGLIGFAAYKGAVGALDAMTEMAPRPLPEVEMTAEESTAANEKFAKAKAALSSEAPEEKVFSFTGDEINTLLRSSDTTGFLGDSVFVKVEDGVVNGDVSLDLGNVMPMLAGRYANGSATFSVSFANERLLIFIEQFKLKGEDAPEEIQAQFRQTNLAEDMMADPEFREGLRNVESIVVEGDKIVVTLK